MRKALPVVFVALLAVAPAARADRMIWTREGEIVDGPAAVASSNRPFALLDAGGGDLYLTDMAITRSAATTRARAGSRRSRATALKGPRATAARSAARASPARSPWRATPRASST
jgi:hypothetical protein